MDRGKHHGPWFVTPSRERAVRHGIVLAAAGLLIVLVAQEVARGWAGDPWAYWATHLNDMYHGFVVGDATYAYSPAFGEAFVPFTWLSWPAFRLIWGAIALAALLWLSVPVSPKWRPAFLLLGFTEVVAGNILLLMAVALVVSFRRPAGWAFILLSKVTPAVAMVWYAARREWRSLAIALGTTAAIVAISYVVAPQFWGEWLRTLIDNRDTAGDTSLPQIPLVIRLPLAAAIVVWGARSNRRWTLAVAMTVALPHVWLQSFVLLAAIPRLNCVAEVPVIKVAVRPLVSRLNLAPI